MNSSIRKYGSGFLILLAAVMMLVVMRPVSAQAASVKRHTVLVGQGKQLKRKGAVWSSKKPKVCTVSETGYVTALKKGKATIIAKVGKKQYKYVFTVEAPTLNKTNRQLKLNKSFTLKVQGTTKKFKFASSDPATASIEKKKNNKVRVTAKKDGAVIIRAYCGSYELICSVITGSGPPVEGPTYTMTYAGGRQVTLTRNQSDTGKYVSSISRFGQSAPLHINALGGDGLESIWGLTNNGNINVPGVKLSEEARIGTIQKACLWARAICDSPYHGYDDGQKREIDGWGVAKENYPGTGDYCCFTLTECAYYFAGVNLLGECLGNKAAAIYPPYSEMLFLRGNVSFWGDDAFGPTSVGPHPKHAKNLFTHAGFTLVAEHVDDNTPVQAGDIAVSNRSCSIHKPAHHMQLILTNGTAGNCEVAEACGAGAGGRKGGDQSGGELQIYKHLYHPQDVTYLFRFTGEGVVLNTAGLTG